MGMRQIGTLKPEQIETMERACFHPDNLYAVAVDGAALWDPVTIDEIVKELPKNLLPEQDMYLLVTECFANATLHSRAEVLGIHARRRKGLLMIAVSQIPPMPRGVEQALHAARAGKMPGYEEASSGGLGFPILVRLTRRVTLSTDCRTIRFWFEVLDF